MKSFECRQNSGQGQPHIRLVAPDSHDHIHHLRLRLVEYDPASPAYGETASYRAGPAAGDPFPGPCADQHSLHPGPVEGGAQEAGGPAAYSGGNILLLAGIEHSLRRSAPQGLSNLLLVTLSSLK